VAGCDLPQTQEGAIVGIADKIDTIVGFFGVGVPATGTSDPYALRRQSLGVINIILDKRYPLTLDLLIDESIALFKGTLKKPADEIKKDILEFFKGRLQNQLISQGLAYDTQSRLYVCEAVTRRLIRLDKRGKIETLAESFELFAQALAGFDKTGSLPKSVPFTPMYGPLTLPDDMGPTTGSVPVAAVIKAAAQIAPKLADTEWQRVPANAVPASIPLGSLRPNAAQFLRLMAQAYLDPSSDKPLSVNAVTLDTRSTFMFPKNTAMTDQGNSWTFKPAPLRVGSKETSGTSAGNSPGTEAPAYVAGVLMRVMTCSLPSGEPGKAEGKATAELPSSSVVSSPT